ncbi:hypothetical protein EZV62_012511 [Acer yangbiense]|uniref:Squalene cyclase C-terminal domain-containing protein n=1 Tax=Acer yangbiense TaxID=1000413 RepID=A0A5C7HWG9_9ROSI|nr:hypothetical protein EZV62_012511 [Acer yangbiense]
MRKLLGSGDQLSVIQSSNGGFPAWEPQRAYRWWEKFNPTEFFEDTLIEREYVECASSAIQGLSLFRKLHPTHRRKEIEDNSIASQKQFDTLKTRRSLMVHEGLAAAGRNYNNSPALRKACEFLLSKQLACGGWGESYLSSRNKANVDPKPIHRGIRVMINSQIEGGDFPQQEITGVFMRNCTLNYSSYRNIFLIWALGEYRSRVLCVTASPFHHYIMLYPLDPLICEHVYDFTTKGNYKDVGI